jgi:hypothetical protein
MGAHSQTTTVDGGAEELWHGHANNRDGRAIHEERAAHDGGSAPEAPRPERIADHDDGMPAEREVVAGSEQPANLSALAQYGEAVSRYELHSTWLRGCGDSSVAGCGDPCRFYAALGTQLGAAGQELTGALENGIGESEIHIAWTRYLRKIELVWLWHGERP